MVSELGKDQNPFAERLFGLHESPNSFFLRNFRDFPGSFPKLSGNFPQLFFAESEELGPQDHAGTKIIVRLLLVVFLEHYT